MKKKLNTRDEYNEESRTEILPFSAQDRQDLNLDDEESNVEIVPSLEQDEQDLDDEESDQLKNEAVKFGMNSSDLAEVIKAAIYSCFWAFVIWIFFTH